MWRFLRDKDERKSLVLTLINRLAKLSVWSENIQILAGIDGIWTKPI